MCEYIWVVVVSYVVDVDDGIFYSRIVLIVGFIVEVCGFIYVKL